MGNIINNSSLSKVIADLKSSNAELQESNNELWSELEGLEANNLSLASKVSSLTTENENLKASSWIASTGQSISPYWVTMPKLFIDKGYMEIDTSNYIQPSLNTTAPLRYACKSLKNFSCTLAMPNQGTSGTMTLYEALNNNYSYLTSSNWANGNKTLFVQDANIIPGGLWTIEFTFRVNYWYLIVPAMYAECMLIKNLKEI